MDQLDVFRHTLASKLGKVLLPEDAVEIERAFFCRPHGAHDPAKFGSAACGTMTFQVERFDSVLGELHELHRLHWAETEVHRHAIEMDPDYDHMRRAEQAGKMIQFTARKDGRLVGHIRMYLHESTHSRTPYGAEDAFYMIPECRVGRAPIRFLQFMESCLRSIGIHEFRASTKAVNTAGRLFEFLGYEPVATQWVKVIKE